MSIVTRNVLATWLLAGGLAVAMLAALPTFWTNQATAASEDDSAAEEEPPADGDAAAATFEVYKDKRGEYRWRLRAQNSQILATSGDGYARKRSCLNAIESVKKAAADAPVQEPEEEEEAEQEDVGDE